MIPGLRSLEAIPLTEALVRASQIAARPAFELRFFNTQEAVLDRLDKKIAEIRNSTDTGSATALLEVELKSLEREAKAIDEYWDRTKTNRINVETIIGQLTDLVALSDPSTVAAFDAKLAETIETIEKLDTPVFEFYGTRDGLRKIKQDALDTLNTLNHNNFATADDISSVQSTLNSISADFSAAVEITRVNEEMAFKLTESLDRQIDDINGTIGSIRLDAQVEKLEKVEKEREHASNVLTALSLAFEASQAITNFVAQNTVYKRQIAPGSVLNLFT